MPEVSWGHSPFWMEAKMDCKQLGASRTPCLSQWHSKLCYVIVEGMEHFLDD